MLFSHCYILQILAPLQFESQRIALMYTTYIVVDNGWGKRVIAHRLLSERQFVNVCNNV